MDGIFKTVAAMKKIMNVFVLVATVAMMLASCQKNEIKAPEKQEVQFTINSGQKSKTMIEATVVDGKTVYKPKWEGNEELGVLFSVPTGETDKNDLTILVNAEEQGTLASFQGSASVTENGTFYSFCPASAFSRGYADGDVRFDLKKEQHPTATSFDPSCDILVAKPYDYTVTDGQVVVDDLSFARIMSVLRINLKSDFADIQNEFVESVSFTAGDVKITGYARVFLDNPDFTGHWASSGDEYCTVTAKYESDLVSIAGSSNSVYVVVAPVTVPAEQPLTFTIKTKNYKITKIVDKHPDMTFTPGQVEPLNLTIKEENCVRVEAPIDDYSGQYLIAGQEAEIWYAAQKYAGDNYLKATPLEFDGENILDIGELSDCYMTITKVVGGDYDGMYTIVDAGGKYLSASSSSSNYLKGVDSLSPDTYWALEQIEDSGTYSLRASKSQYERNDMRFNYNNGSPRVSCYDPEKTKQPYLTLFSTALVKVDMTPKLEVSPTSVDLPAAGGAGTITVTARNVNDVQVRVLDEVDWLEATYAEGKISYSAEANDSEKRTATIEVYAVDADDNEIVKSISVTQAGKPAEGDESGWVSKSFADLKDGDQVVIVSTKGTSIYAMPNNNGTGSAPGVVSVEYADSKLSAEPSTTIVWYVGVDGDNRIFYANSDKTTWLYCTNANNGVRVGTNTNKTFTFDEATGYLKHIGTSRYLGVYNNQDWRCYTNTTGNTVGQTFQFFVKSSEESGGEQPEPVKLGTPSVTCEVENTTENSLTFTWTAVGNAVKYRVECNNETVELENAITSYTATDLVAGTEYSISVTALGDGINYTDSDAGTCTATTKEVQSGGNETRYSVTYTVASKESVETSGDAPNGSSATFLNTYGSNKLQMTKDNSQTYTLSGYDGCTITGITLSMKSNKSAGAGSLSVKSGSKTIASIADSKFNTASWYGNWSQDFVNITPTVTAQVVGTGEKVVVEINASANSLYCQSITITYESAGDAGGGSGVDMNPEGGNM